MVVVCLCFTCPHCWLLVVAVVVSGFHLVLDTLATASYGWLGSIP